MGDKQDFDVSSKGNLVYRLGIHRTLHSDNNSISTLLDCPRKTPDSLTETNSEKRPTIICVILLVFILLLVLMFLLYRRRALCFGKVKKQKMTDNNVRVELQDVENYEEPEYEVCYDCTQDSVLSRARLER